MNSWLIDWLISQIRTAGPKVILQVLQGVAPLLKEQAAKTGNKFDDYFAQQVDRIAHDPEFITLVERWKWSS